MPSIKNNIKRGDLVEYKNPLNHSPDLFGVVLRIAEVTSNVYERGYTGATVKWNVEVWKGKGKHLMSPSELFETFEDVTRLKKISD